MPNKASEKAIVFPAQTTEIIAEILKKYKINESPKEIYEKIKAGKISIPPLTAELVKKRAMGKIDLKTMASSLKRATDLSLPAIKELSEELEAKVVSLAKSPAEQTADYQKSKPPAAPRKTIGSDVYREPIA